MHHTVIQIENAVVSFQEHIALKRVSLEVHDGEFIGLIGPNGAGKTTLLTLMNGLGKLISGSVNVLGHEVAAGNGHVLRKKVGYVSQAQVIDPRTPFSVRDITIMGRYGRLGWLKGTSRNDWRIADEMLDLVGMKKLAARPIGHLSGGEQQRVAIARCLTQEPEIFLLDEPTASLDWRAKTEIFELVKQIHDSRRLTTLFVTHDLGSLPTACSRMIMMKEGRIWLDGPTREVLTDSNLSYLYDLPLSIVQKRKGELFSA